MACTILSLKASVGGIDDATQSVLSFREVLGCLPEARARSFIDGIELLLDNDGILRVELPGSTAEGATIIQPINFFPSDRYVELVSALSSNGDVDFVCGDHGWPILSFVAATATMADGAAESIRGTESAEA